MEDPDVQPEHVNKLILFAKRTQLEMLKDRGYTIPLFELPILDRKAGVLSLKLIYGNALESINQIYAKGNKRTSIWYQTDFKALNSQTINSFCTDIQMKQMAFQADPLIEFECAIMVTASIPPSQLLRKLDDCILVADKKDNPVIQTFTLHDLLFNATKHVYVPKHRLLSETENSLVYRKSIGGSAYDKVDLTKQSHTKNVLPILKVKHVFVADRKTEDFGDPIAKYYFAHPGDIFEVTRVNIYNDNMLPLEIAYRYVV
jgi:DNA-directed RNA polymerase subunit H (RpoH/RPB5)